MLSTLNNQWRRRSDRVAVKNRQGSGSEETQAKGASSFQTCAPPCSVSFAIKQTSSASFELVSVEARLHPRLVQSL
jgi:hypothetical protein